MPPVYFWVRGKKWKIVYGDPGDGNDGACIASSRVIVLSPSLRDDPDRHREVLLHEIKHARSWRTPEAKVRRESRQEARLLALLVPHANQ